MAARAPPAPPVTGQLSSPAGRLALLLASRCRGRGCGTRAMSPGTITSKPRDVAGGSWAHKGPLLGQGASPLGGLCPLRGTGWELPVSRCLRRPLIVELPGPAPPRRGQCLPAGHHEAPLSAWVRAIWLQGGGPRFRAMPRARPPARPALLAKLPHRPSASWDPALGARLGPLAKPRPGVCLLLAPTV